MQSGFLARLGGALASFRNALRGPALALPAEGRSSVESNRGVSGYLSGLGSVTPVVDFELLATLNYLAIYNPDFSQYVENIVNLGNPGHSLTIDAASDSVAEAALGRLNDAASRLYAPGGGVDGLINAMLRQLAVLGAISSEDVVNLAARRVEQVVIVPVEEIRFKYIDGEYRPFQKPRTGLVRGDLGLIELNPVTYQYYALQTVENSPYAKPPASSVAALLTGPQADVVDNIKFIVAKLGILGMVSVNVAPPRQKGGETDAEYQTRAASYLRAVRESLEGNFNKGLVVTYRDQKVEHANVAANATSGMEIVKWLEQFVMSGFGIPPAFFGRTDSTTETYANVVYNQLLAKVGNFQRLAKRRQEATYRLDLRLDGIEVDGLSVVFDQAHPRDPLAEATAASVRQRDILDRARNGIISADQAAQELGYESADDPGVLDADPEAAQSFGAALMGGMGVSRGAALSFHFDKRTQRYSFVRPVLSLAGAKREESAENLGNVVPMVGKKKASAIR